MQPFPHRFEEAFIYVLFIHFVLSIIVFNIYIYYSILFHFILCMFKKRIAHMLSLLLVLLVIEKKRVPVVLVPR